MTSQMYTFRYEETVGAVQVEDELEVELKEPLALADCLQLYE